MAIGKGSKRYQHKVTEDVKYFKNEPDLNMWIKVGTPGSVNWKWINNTVEERYVKKDVELPEGFSLGRIKI